MTTVYAFAGKRGSGKSTASKVLTDMGYIDLKFADPLKNMLRAFYRAHDLSPDEIERRIEGDLKEAPCEFLAGRPIGKAVPEHFTEVGLGLLMMDALYRTCGLEARDIKWKLYSGEREDPCDWLNGATPARAMELLSDKITACDTPRLAMQLLGTEWRNAINPPRSTSMWADIFVKRVRSGAYGDKIVCSDFRFPGHEEAALKELGAHTFRINRPGGPNDEYAKHSSETGIDQLKVGGVLNNNGTIEDLQGFISDLVEAKDAIAHIDFKALLVG